MILVLTCEHGGNYIPENYLPYFKNKDTVLNSHRGYDSGALHLFNTLKEIASYSKYSKTSRLVIELNRSVHHKNLFSEYTKPLSIAEKELLINGYYANYRNAITAEIKNLIATKETVLHISVHSFTPTLHTVERNCDIGLLYDSTKSIEKVFCSHFKKEIKKLDTTLKVRYNYPYIGKADGFTSFLRKKFPENYMGIELEVNQKFSNQNKFSNHLHKTLLNALKKLVEPN
tara:strand:- start:9626 stop:10315 length:690 start_codon:yes stop_codon:yes gene_type:complete